MSTWWRLAANAADSAPAAVLAACPRVRHCGWMRSLPKRPSANGFEPLEFIAKLAALVPKPRVNLTRFHGVFAPNSHHRVHVTPAKRGKQADKPTASDTDWLDKSPDQRHKAMAGFCSCKTGIHAIHGNNLDAAA